MGAKRLRRVLGIVGVFAIVFGAFAVLQMATATETGHVYMAEFEKVTGLVPHSEVTFSGAKVGEVAEITYTEDGRGALLTLAFDKDLRLREDAKAEIKLKSLLGEQFVEIDPGTSPRALAADRIEHTASDLSLDDLLHSLAGLLGDISDSGQVARLVEDLTTTFEGKGEDLRVIMDDSRIMLESMSERAEVLAGILTNLDTLTAGLDGKEAALGDVLAQMSATLKELRQALGKNVETLENAIGTLRTSLAQIEVSKIDQALAEVPQWLEKFDHVFGLLEGLVTGEKPIYANIVALPPMDQRGLDEQLAAMGRIPWLREYLIAAFADIVDRTTPRSERGRQAPGVDAPG